MEELKIVRALLDKINPAITYCHWKSNQHFSDARKGIDDLDILIDRKQYDELSKILAELGFKKFYTPQARTYIGIEDFLGFDSDTGKIVHLHLHCRLVVGEKHLKGFHLPIERQVLENRVWSAEHQAYLSSPFDELLLLILRLAMKHRKRDVWKKKITEKNTFAESRWLKEQCPDFILELEKQEWLTPRIKACIADCYTEGFSWAAMHTFQKYLYRDFSCFCLWGGSGNTASRHVHEFQRIVLEVKKRFLKTKYTFLRRRPVTGGITIAFLGADGAGKSSAIQEMEKWLKKVMDVRCFYLGSGEGNSSVFRMPLKFAKRMAQKLGIIQATNNFSDSSLQETKRSGKLEKAREFWIYTLSAERIRKLTQVNRCRMRGFVVLTDRYPQIEFDGLCDGPKLRGGQGFAAVKEAEAYRIAKLCPPDLAIKLIVSPEVAMERKPGEIDLETSKNLTERVKAIRFSDMTQIAEIDADQPQKQVFLEIKQAIWNAI